MSFNFRKLLKEKQFFFIEIITKTRKKKNPLKINESTLSFELKKKNSFILLVRIVPNDSQLINLSKIVFIDVINFVDDGASKILKYTIQHLWITLVTSSSLCHRICRYVNCMHSTHLL